MDNFPQYVVNDLSSPEPISSPNYSKASTPPPTLKRHLSIRIDNQLNHDLMTDNQFFMDEEDIVPLPRLEQFSISGIDEFFAPDVANYTAIEVQSQMSNPYLLLETCACLCFNVVLFCNAFMFSLINNTVGVNTDIVVRFVIAKAINLSCLGLITYVFTTPDTYKSINLTIEYLSVNVIIYEYSFMTIMKYLIIHICMAVIAAFLTIGIYYDIIEHIPTTILLSSILPTTKTYSFTYSYAIIAVIMHMATAVGLTIISNAATSMNARRKAIHKAVLLFFINITFGAVIGPLGYIWQHLMLYSAMIIIRKEHSLFNIELFITYVVMIIAVIIVYPIIAIQIKFFWRNKYRRYIEYGTKK